MQSRRTVEEQLARRAVDRCVKSFEIIDWDAEAPTEAV